MRDLDRIFRLQPMARIPGMFLDAERGKIGVRPQGITIKQINQTSISTAYVPHSLYDAHTILYAITDNTPIALVVGASTVVGRKATGNIVALTAAELITVLGGTSRTFMVNNFLCPAPGVGWTPQLEGVRLGASLTALKCWLPLNFLKIGDIITAYNLVGDATEAVALTLDCKLVRINLADPITTTDITNGAIVQVTAGGNFDVAANPDDETVATDKQYALEILGTTGAGDEIIVMGAEVTVTRLI